MKHFIHASAAAALATASLAAQADTFSFTSEFDDLSGFTTSVNKGGSSTVTLNSLEGDNFAALAGTDFLAYTFTLSSASDVDISFFYNITGTKNKSSNATVSWLSGNQPVSLVPGSSSLNLNVTNGNSNVANVAPSPAGTQATYSADGLAAGTYSFKIAAAPGGNTSFRVDTFAVNSVTAVPEPETYAMMLAGLGAIGVMSRRRKRG